MNNMELKLILKLSYDVLKRDLTRSVLTLIGIFLGLFIAVLILGIGKGVIVEVEELFSTFGVNNIMIIPIKFETGFSSSTAIREFKESDIDSLKGMGCVSIISKSVYKRTRATYKDKTAFITVFGVTSNMFDQYSDYLKIEKGRVFKEGERNVVVLGNEAATKLFKEIIE